jgi:hypothetical protein
MQSSSHTLDRLTVTFDDDHAVADAGLVLPATLLDHLGVEATADAVVSCGYRPGRKVVTVLAGLLVGADCIDDLAILRAGATERILPTQVVAPSTIGTWLRSLSFGHIRQLDRLSELLLTRGWGAGAGPSDDLVIDVDSTVCEVARVRQAGRGVRLHPHTGLPPAAGDPRGHRRGAPHPHAERVGEHRPRRAAVRP